MSVEYNSKCTGCEKVDGPTFARNYPHKVNGNWQWYCQHCWNSAETLKGDEPMSNKQQEAEEKDQLIGQFITYVRGWGANDKKIRIEYATKCAEIALEFHTQKRAEELEGITEELINNAPEMDVINKALEYDKRDVAKAQLILRQRELVINHLKNKE